MTEMDTDFMLKTLDHIKVFEDGTLLVVFLDGTVMKDYEKLAELADAVAGVNKNLQEITYSSENMSTETKGVLQSIGKLQQNMRQFRV